MVFFNYSTMQMAAKVVYYGPGLCGKTTNLQYIYSHTVDDARGEMVSLETETDRTLFFDLLPIDVGSIAGFTTRIQLYTVPGQVFYNTTRKLVLKGVDGVVFVADSQRPMLQANIDSFKNLEENLEEMGLSVDTIPLVIQYNKQDLKDICEVEELNQAVNRGDWPSYGSSAITGEGVFETLKGISRLTLLSLKRRLAKGHQPMAGTRPAAAGRAPQAAAPPVRAAEASPPPDAQPIPEAPPAPVAPPAGAAPQAPSPRSAVQPRYASSSRPPEARKVKAKSAGDVLAELEKIRQQTLSSAPPARPRATPTPNGGQEITREIRLTLDRDDFERAQKLLLNLQVEDGDHRVVDALKDFQVDLADIERDDALILRLSIDVRAK